MTPSYEAAISASAPLTKSRRCTAKQFHTFPFDCATHKHCLNIMSTPAPRKVKDTQLYDVLGVAPEAKDIEYVDKEIAQGALTTG